jgi:hypothetical protein
MIINLEWRKLSAVLPVKTVPKVAREEKWAASSETRPHQVVQPPKRAKKRRPAFRNPCRGLLEPE